MGSVVGAELVCETGPDYVFSFLFDLSFSQSVIIRAVLKSVSEADMAQIVNLRLAPRLYAS
jgi:hypothetical protein